MIEQTPRPYKLLGCVHHDCPACVIREQQYKERCEELADLKHDIERHVQIAADLVNENEKLRELAKALESALTAFPTEVHAARIALRAAIGEEP